MLTIRLSLVAGLLIPSISHAGTSDEPQSYTHKCVHLKASDAALTLKSILGEQQSDAKQPAYSLSFDGRTNTILLTGSAERIATAKKVLARLDVDQSTQVVCGTSHTLQTHKVAHGKAEVLAYALEVFCKNSEHYSAVRAFGGNLIMVYANPEQQDAIAKLLAAFGATRKSSDETKTAPKQAPDLGVKTEIHKAAAAGELDKVEMLLARDPRLISSLSEDRETPLHIAVTHSQLEVVKFLLERGADVNARAYNQFTPLHLASDPKVVEAVLKFKPDLRSSDLVERAAAEFALYSRLPDDAWLVNQPTTKDVAAAWLRIVTLLKEAGAPYDIHAAVYMKDLDRIRQLLKDDKTLVKNPKRALTRPLELACREGSTAVCKLLLEHGADPNGIDYYLPALALALDHPRVVKLLLESGGSVTGRISRPRVGGSTGVNWIGEDATILHYAAGSGAVESAKLLLAKGVRVDDVDDQGQTPLHIAAKLNEPDMVRFLLDRGANVNAKDKEGMTPLANALLPWLIPREKVAEILRQRGGKK